MGAVAADWEQWHSQLARHWAKEGLTNGHRSGHSKILYRVTVSRLKMSCRSSF
jgi:hypothetical protein